MTTQNHAELRRDREAEIARLQVKLRGLEDSAAVEQKAVDALDAGIAALAEKAAGGDPAALKKQRGLLDQKAERALQHSNLSALAAPLRARIAELQAELPGLEVSEQIEAVLEQLADLPRLAARLSGLIAPVAEEFRIFQERVRSGLRTALPLLGADARRLETGLLQALPSGLRAHLNKEFSAAGFQLFGALPGEDFEAVVTPKLEDLHEALQSRLHTNAGIPTAGRAFFRATTNIGGLFGRDIQAGERISLPVDDAAVVRMVAQGALEREESEAA